MNQEYLVEQVLDFLQVKRQEPTLHFLNELIHSHQKKVRWENLSKFQDYEVGYQTEQFLPTIEHYFTRMLEHGYGGTCWTLARGLHWLLEQLDFQVHYLYMDAGHLCLRVELDQPYYVDVGYCAPLFQAYPLYQSFEVFNAREKFEYLVTEIEGSVEIKVVRTPGPTKLLNPNPVSLEEMLPLIKRSNQWESAMALRDILVFGYIDDVPTSITNQTLKQHLPDKKVEKELSPEELEYWIVDRFQMNLEMYRKAIEIFNRRSVQSQSGQTVAE